MRIGMSGATSDDMPSSWGRRMRASIVAALLGTACCCTLVLYSRDAAAEYADLSASKEATAELAMATSEIHRYDTGLRLSPSRQHVLSSPARKTVLWNAAENDEVHVDQNGHLSQAVPFPPKAHKNFEKRANEDDALAPKVARMVAAAGSETEALEKAAREEARLKSELRAQAKLEEERAVAPSAAPSLETVSVQEDPGKLAACLTGMKAGGLDEAEALAKCIAAAQQDKNTVTTVEDESVEKNAGGGDKSKEESARRAPAPAREQAAEKAARKPASKMAKLQLTRSDVPKSQWDNVTEWGPDVKYVEQARGEVVNPPRPDGLGQVPDELQKFVNEVNVLRDHDDAPLLDVKDAPPADVQAWQAFADRLKDSGITGDAYMSHIKTSASNEGSTPQQQPSAAAPATASNPLADRGDGDLFWDIVKGRVDMTPPPIGELGGSSPQEHASQASQLEEVAPQFPPQCPMRAGGPKDQCVGSGEECELCLSGNGFCKPTGGSLSVSKIDGKGGLADYYFLNIMGTVGHPIRVIMRASDGYHRSWEQFGQLWTDKIHKPGGKGRSADAVDHLQVQDLTTGEIAFFRFPCAPVTGRAGEYSDKAPPATALQRVMEEEEEGGKGNGSVMPLNINIYVGKDEDRPLVTKHKHPSAIAPTIAPSASTQTSGSSPASVGAAAAQLATPSEGVPGASVSAAREQADTGVKRYADAVADLEMPPLVNAGEQVHKDGGDVEENVNRALKARVAELENKLRDDEGMFYRAQAGAGSGVRREQGQPQEGTDELGGVEGDARGVGYGSSVSSLQREEERLTEEAREELGDNEGPAVRRDADELPRKFSQDAIERLVRRQERDVVKKQVTTEVKREVRHEVERQEEQRRAAELAAEVQERVAESEDRAAKEQSAAESGSEFGGWQEGNEGGAGGRLAEVEGWRAQSTLNEGEQDAFANAERRQRRREISSDVRRDDEMMDDDSGEVMSV